MPTHKSSDYKLSAVKYYLSHSKNQVQRCKMVSNKVQREKMFFLTRPFFAQIHTK